MTSLMGPAVIEPGKFANWIAPPRARHQQPAERLRVRAFQLMAGGISIHVYDVSRGVPAAGLRVELTRPDGKLLVDAQTAKPGTLDGPTPLVGTYEAVFHIGDWYRARRRGPLARLPRSRAVPLRRRRPRAALSPAAQDDALGLLTFPWRGLTMGMAIAYPCAAHWGGTHDRAQNCPGIGRRVRLGPRSTAQQWPGRAVKIIVTFPPGGASDAAARVIAGPLQDKLGQTVIVDNKPGGGTTIGANFVLAAKDDYHTLMLSNSAPISIAPYLFDKPPYDPLKDFVHVAYIGSVANAFVVRPPCRPRPCRS